MNKRLIIPIVFAVCLAAVWFFTKQQTTSPNFDDVPFVIKKKKKAQRIKEALDENAEKTKDLSLGYPPSERLLEAYQIINQKRIEKKANRGTPNGLEDIIWKERGPYNIGGRTRAILIDQGDPTQNTVFAAGVSGGLWKTTTIKRNPPEWVPINDNFQNLAICTITQDPNNPEVMYFGTGEGYGSNGFVRGLGIWKSTDGGDNWSHLLNTVNGDFNYTLRLLVHPNGDVYAVTLNGGLKRSQDGGETWNTVLGPGTPGGKNDMTDIEIGADGTLYASGGHINGNGSVWRSDAGSTVGDIGTWVDQSNGIPNNVRRIELATSPSNENIIYAVTTIQNTSNNVYRSSDRGATWEPRDLPPSGFAAGQGWYNLCIAVDPNNSNRLIIGALNQFMSTNGGSSWTLISGGVHVDQHFILYEPGNSNVVYLGNDGGVFRSENAGGSPNSVRFTNRNDRYNVTQFYACAMHPGIYSNFFLAGSQDNGTQRFNAVGIAETTYAFGADGAYCHIDQNEPQYQIVSWQFGNYLLSDNEGESFNAGGVSIGVGFINESDYDDDANILYAYGGAGQIYRWDITEPDGEFLQVNSPNSFRHLTVSPNVANRIYIGSTNGQIMRIDNADQGTSLTGTSISGNISPGFISDIAIELGNEDHLLATISNYGTNSVWETTDGGATWTSVEGNLPDIPVRGAIFNPIDPSQAFLATEAGVWTTNALNGTSTSWEPNLSMPSVRTDMLQTRTSDNAIIAGTHGRGLWSTDAFSPPKAIIAPEQVTYLQANKQFLDFSVNPTEWLWDFGDGTTSTLQNPRHSYNEIGTYNVSLTINGALSDAENVRVLPDRATPYDLESSNYGGDFESQPEDFGVSTTSGTTFQLGNSSVAGKSGTHSGANAWVTGLNDNFYEHNTESILFTPNYELRWPGIYEFSFWAKYDIQQGFDGFRVEYSTDRGNSWSILGERGENWYNYSNQNAEVPTVFPAGSDYFTGRTVGTDFKQYKTNLNILDGAEHVAFRFVFRSDSETRYPGLAIDDIEVRALTEGLATNVISLTAQFKNQDEVELNWITGVEYRCQGFEIETSKNGRDFDLVTLPYSFTDGQGYSAEQTGYLLTPDQPFKLDLYYFRLKVYDFDGEFFYTETLVLKREENDELAQPHLVYPNPFHDFIDIAFNADMAGQTVQLELYDSAGRLMKKEENVAIQGVYHRMEVGGLAPGFYVLRTRIGDKRYTQKLRKM